MGESFFSQLGLKNRMFCYQKILLTSSFGKADSSHRVNFFPSAFHCLEKEWKRIGKDQVELAKLLSSSRPSEIHKSRRKSCLWVLLKRKRPVSPHRRRRGWLWLINWPFSFGGAASSLQRQFVDGVTKERQRNQSGAIPRKGAKHHELEKNQVKNKSLGTMRLLATGKSEKNISHAYLLVSDLLLICKIDLFWEKILYANLIR